MILEPVLQSLTGLMSGAERRFQRQWQLLKTIQHQPQKSKQLRSIWDAKFVDSRIDELCYIDCIAWRKGMKTARHLIEDQKLSVVSKNQTVFEVAKLMTEKNIGAVPVVERNRVVGIFSERDIMKRVVAKNLDPQKTRVEDVMSTELIVGSPEEDIVSIESRMKQAGIRHLPIISEDQLIGILSLRDLLQAEMDEKDEEIKIMTAYIHYIPPTFEG
jgi:CBS domain-containing protein